MARAFESAIESCSDIENSYLVDGTTKPDMFPALSQTSRIENLQRDTRLFLHR